MKKYRNNAASDIRVSYGIEVCAGLRFFPETATYAGSFESLNNDLDAAYTKRLQLRKPLLEKRAAFRFAQYDTDQMIWFFQSWMTGKAQQTMANQVITDRDLRSFIMVTRTLNAKIPPLCSQ